MRVILCYKNFAANKNISHIGLGVAALNTCKTLQANGIACDVWPILNAADLIKNLLSDNLSPAISHVVISAPWIPTLDIHKLCGLFPRIHFAVSSHSNVGFLQADANGTKLFREALEIEMALPNFSTAANSEKMAKWVIDAYGRNCESLPNLYFLSGHPKKNKSLWNGGVLKIGSFGATRPQKNLASSVAGAIEIAYQLKAQTEIWISSGRIEGGALTIVNTLKALTDGIPNVTLKEAGWITWPKFRQLVGTMNLLLQPSYTESFNMITADGIAEGVPSVVGESINWAPSHWTANVDDVFDIARVGRNLLQDVHAVHDGTHALSSYVSRGIVLWKDYLSRTIKAF